MSAQGGLPDGLLDDRFVQVVTMLHPRTPIQVVRRSREDPLPDPLLVGVRILADQGVREGRPAQTKGEIGFVLLAHGPQVVLERLM
jgi:hypothetical protein